MFAAPLFEFETGPGYASIWIMQARRGFRALTVVLVLIAFLRVTSADPIPARLSIEKSAYGTTQQGEAVELYTLRNANGITARVITYGAIIESLEVPDKAGHFTNVNANCASLADYENKSPCFGAVIGRYANRIAHGQFTPGRQNGFGPQKRRATPYSRRCARFPQARVESRTHPRWGFRGGAIDLCRKRR